MKRLAIVLALALVFAACSGTEPGSDPESADDPVTTAAASQDTQAPADEPEPEEPAEEQAPAPQGEVAITLTIGDETWEFIGSLCAYVNALPGDEGSEWNVSMVQDGLQVYISDDSFGTLVSMADIENGANATVNWEASGDNLQLTVDGNDISATGTFRDEVNGGTAEGTLSATCADWFDAT
ncbi:MAG: hypothetical protein U9N56_00320 [Actinomycetota bacterium]|nr:hypothetical protein [Actinomycetota bacterium]